VVLRASKAPGRLDAADVSSAILISMGDETQMKPYKRDDVVCKSARRETLLYDPVTDSVHVLNPTALIVWELCDGHHTPAEMEAALRARFGGTAKQDVAGDVQAVLALFENEGLITHLP
jgi:hypothetical protein